MPYKKALWDATHKILAYMPHMAHTMILILGQHE